MKGNFTDAFEWIEAEFEKILTEERALFESTLYQQNMKELYQLRMDYLAKHVDKS